MAGEPLPPVFQTLEDYGTQFLRGQLVMIVAGPGTGKSAVALTLALKSGAPFLYFSADSDAYTQLTRSISVLTGQYMSESVRMVRSNDVSAVVDALENVPGRFNHEAAPTLDTIDDEMESYEEVNGEYPALTIVDNLMDLQHEEGAEGNSYAGLEANLRYLHEMARKTSTCVVVLHHAVGSYTNSDKPIPLDGVLGKVTKIPEVVITLFSNLCFSVVKNRGKKADPSGEDYLNFDFNPDKMQITDIDYSSRNAESSSNLGEVLW